MFKKILLIVGLSLAIASEAKVLILIPAYNRPDFIEVQHKTFQKLLEDDYELVVFNNADNSLMHGQMHAMCEKLGLRCIDVPQEIHNRPYLFREPGENYNHPTVRNVNTVQYSLNTLGFDHNDIVLLCDSDLFLVKKFSIRKFLAGYDLGGALGANGYVNYLWHGLAFLDMRALPNNRSLSFNCGRVDGKPIDGGGHSYYYLKSNPDVKARYVNHHHVGDFQCDQCRREHRLVCLHNTVLLERAGFDEHQIRFLQSAHNVEFFHNNTFLHYRGGTNWDNKSGQYHKQKTDALQKYLDAVLQ